MVSGGAYHICKCVPQEIFPETKFINKLWQTRKISSDTAMRDLLKSRSRGAYGVFMQIQKIRREEIRYELEDESERILRKLYAARAPTRRHLTVNEWFQHVQGLEEETMERAKNLLLLGDSWSGKTSAATSWTKPEETLLVNCQGLPDGTLPSIDGAHERGKKWIIWEEIKVQQVLQNKRLFQSTAYTLQLGDSACHAFSYTVLPYKFRHILCTNIFPMTRAEDPTLTEADEDYLSKNFYIPLLKPKQRWFRVESTDTDLEMTNAWALAAMRVEEKVTPLAMRVLAMGGA